MKPLSEQYRPEDLEAFVGQAHLMGEGKPLRRIFWQQERIPSMIFWGPPGCGKTSMARVISKLPQVNYHSLSATSAGVKEVQKILNENTGLFAQQQKVLFIDEIHRFNKLQQDALLEAVEKGWIALIGATTEKPQRSVNRALLSRCQVFEFKALPNESLQIIAFRIIRNFEKPELFSESILTKIISISDGDARKLISFLELTHQAIMVENLDSLDEEKLESILSNQKFSHLDPRTKYDLMSAFIKSIRGSDVQAAVYYLARMLRAGEDPVYIGRRLVISASEDIGLANPNALLLANASLNASKEIGMPEAKIILSECAIYLAQSKKSNASYTAINKALQYVEQTGNLSVPYHLMNQKSYLDKTGIDQTEYLYPHDYADAQVSQDYLPKEAKGVKFYEPK